MDECEVALKRKGGDFEAMAQERLTELLPSRLNPTRIDSCIHHTNPERRLLLELAGGMEVDLPVGFIPNGEAPETRSTLRKMYVKAHLAVDCMFYAIYTQGLAFLLKTDTALKVKGVHFSPAHWAKKAEKACGRPIIDSTDANSRYPVLNTEEVSDMARARWGEIVHPTIEDFILMIIGFVERQPGLTMADVDPWKTDLRGAYTMMSFKASNCMKFAVELVGGTMIIFLCRLFGWSSTPAAFQVITRAIIFELGRILLGMALMYIDDIVGISKRSELQHDLDAARGVCTTLLGKHAVQDDKTLFTTDKERRLAVIGYTIDLEKQVVTMSRRNLLKNMYLFFSTDTDRAVTVATMETIAALASRYSIICREMRPFSKALHGSFKGLTNERVSFRLKEDAVRSIEMWRAMLCMLAFDEARFARPFDSFGVRTANITIQFDASLEGAGFVIYKRHPISGVESILGLQWCLY